MPSHKSHMLDLLMRWVIYRTLGVEVAFNIVATFASSPYLTWSFINLSKGYKREPFTFRHTNV
jgi:uncharacterized membrane protein YjjB (DUF3815 family)